MLPFRTWPTSLDVYAAATGRAQQSTTNLMSFYSARVRSLRETTPLPAFEEKRGPHIHSNFSQVPDIHMVPSACFRCCQAYQPSVSKHKNILNAQTIAKGVHMTPSKVLRLLGRFRPREIPQAFEHANTQYTQSCSPTSRGPKEKKKVASSGSSARAPLLNEVAGRWSLAGDPTPFEQRQQQTG